MDTLIGWIRGSIRFDDRPDKRIARISGSPG
jgi:hypothetical protein